MENEEVDKPKPRRARKLLLALLSTAILIIALIPAFYLFVKQKEKSGGLLPGIVAPKTKITLKKFKSEEEFLNYISEAQKVSGEEEGFWGVSTGSDLMQLEAAPMAITDNAQEAGRYLERVSETNVQVKGIDEADIVKSDGKNIYYSAETAYILERGMPVSTEIYPPPDRGGMTRVIEAFPPDALAEKGEIDEGGTLLLSKNRLVVLGDKKISGFDVSDSTNPKKDWEYLMDGNFYKLDSRLFQNKLYILGKSMEVAKCPVPVFEGDNARSIGCDEIYYPNVTTGADAVFIIVVINPEDGSVIKEISLVGSAGMSVFYMSNNSIFLTYPVNVDTSAFIINFFETEGEDLIDDDTLSKLIKLRAYEISPRSKITEIGIVIEAYYQKIPRDERLRVENEVVNRMQDYFKEKGRELERTAITRIDSESLEIKASGEVPGAPLNQFSLDEYENHLRVATTIGSGFMGGESVNDVYILDEKLEKTGEVKDLGISERIYSVRFIEERGYVVTFRQIDPFYVLDLSDSGKPKLAGELKIPGYSSYLHPLDKNVILGVGEEDGRVKLSMFDVSNAGEPRETGKYLLDEYWSEVSSTHHAFLADAKHKAFFLPGSKGGYVFSYAGNESPELIKAVSDINARRALYINNFLYVLGGDKIVVFDENNWEEVKSLVY